MATRRKKSADRFARVTITFEGPTARCKPDDAQLYYDRPEGPNSVRWSVGPLPEGATRVVVKWEVASPFLHLGVEVPRGNGEQLVLLGTGNLRETGVFHYSVMAVDDKGNVVAGVDPKIINEPFPPVDFD